MMWRSSHGTRLPDGAPLPVLSVGGQTSTPLDEASVLPCRPQWSEHPMRAYNKPPVPNQKLSQGVGAFIFNGHLCICRFQLVGIACLRAAMGDVQRKRGFHDDRLASNLAPDRFAYISDSTYTEAQVVDMTATVQDCTTDDLQTSPNSKMFLRSFWYRLVQASAVSSEEMHIYTLSRYFCHQHQLRLLIVALIACGWPSWFQMDD